MSYFDYREQSEIEETDRQNSEEDTPPSEEEFEEVAVFVFFPNVRPGQSKLGHFVLKSRITTLAIEGMTTEEGASVAEADGTATDGGDGSGEGTNNGGVSK